MRHYVAQFACELEHDDREADSHTTDAREERCRADESENAWRDIVGCVGEDVTNEPAEQSAGVERGDDDSGGDLMLIRIRYKQSRIHFNTLQPKVMMVRKSLVRVP